MQFDVVRNVAVIGRKFLLIGRVMSHILKCLGLFADPPHSGKERQAASALRSSSQGDDTSPSS